MGLLALVQACFFRLQKTDEDGTPSNGKFTRWPHVISLFDKHLASRRTLPQSRTPGLGVFERQKWGPLIISPMEVKWGPSESETYWGRVYDWRPLIVSQTGVKWGPQNQWYEAPIIIELIHDPQNRPKGSHVSSVIILVCNFYQSSASYALLMRVVNFQKR